MKKTISIFFCLILSAVAWATSDTIPGTTTTYRLCPGDGQMVNNEWITQSGTYSYLREELIPLLLPTEEEDGPQYDSIYHQDTTIIVVLDYNRSETIQFFLNDHILWHGQYIDRTGTYIDPNTSVEGCDSTYELTAILRTSYLFETDTVICQNDLPFEWHGKLLGELGTHTYESAYTSEDGLDSVYRIHITINPVYREDYQINICPGTSVEYLGVRYSKPGEYQQILHSEFGCDSIIHIHVNYQHSFLQVDSVGINDGGSYYWAVTDSTYAIPDRYEVYEKMQNGCDSIHRLLLYRNPKYFFSEKRSICDPDTLPRYIWRNRPINESGVYWDSLRTIQGQDSVYKLELTIKQRTDTTIYMTLCPADEYRFGNILVDHTGLYKDTISNKAGCDSIITLSVTVIDNRELRYDTICDGDTIFWHGDTLTVENFYEKRVPDEINNCDSIFEMHLTMLYPFTHDSKDTICESYLLNKEPYLWGPNKRELWGKWNNETGHYEDSIYWNCDHTHYLHLHVLPEQYQRENITLCQGDSVSRTLHNGRTVFFKESGYYYDTIPTGNNEKVFACDQVVCYHVSVLPTHTDTIFRTLDISTFPYRWKGHTITGPGYYTDSTKTKNHGCDSVTVLAVTTLTRLTHPLCQGDSVEFGLQYLHSEGNYTYTYSHPSGLDSIVQLTINMLPSHQMTQTAHVSDQEDFTWHLRDADGTKHVRFFPHPVIPGTYTDTVRSSLNCDSIITLTISVHPTYLMPETIQVCQSEIPYKWHNQQLSADGDYTQEYKTKTWNYDSIHTVHFTILPTYLTRLTYRECNGQSIQFNNKVYSFPGVYQDTIPTKHTGCDSIFIIDFQWYDSYFTALTDKCDDKSLPYNWKVGDITRELYHAGTYFEPLKSVNGCDSIVKLTLTVYQTYHFHENIRVCASELPYQWHQQQLTLSGVYEDNLTTQLGYDSTYTVHFTVMDTTMTDIYYDMCQDDTYKFGNRILHDAGIYQDTLKNTEGCDSIVTLHLKVRPKYAWSTPASIRKGTSYEWRGQSLTRSGVYADTLTAKNGCDSIIMLELLVYDNEIIVDEGAIDVCRENLPHVWRGHYLYENKTYYDTILSPSTDTIYILQLRVQEVEDEIHEAVLCDGDYFEWRGERITRDTLYRTVENIGNGCSSQHSIYVRFRKAQTLIFNEKTDDKHPYTWHINGNTYSTSGTYRHTIRTKDQQCDSIHNILHLTVGATYSYKDTISLCQNDLPYEWHGQTIKGTGTYTDSLETVLHYDSTFLLVVSEILPIYHQTEYIKLCENAGPYEYRGKKYSQTGTFYDTIPAKNGCDSIFAIHVRIFPTKKSHVTIDISDKETPYLWNGQSLTKTGQALARLQTTEGCDSIVELNLRIHPTHYIEEHFETCANEPFTWHGKTYQESGTYYDSLSTTVWGYDSVHALILTVHPTYLFEEHVQIKRGATTTIHGLDISREGTYMDTLTSLHGCDSVYRITANYARSYRQEYNDTICDGESYTFYGRTYTQTETLTEVLGPDSVEICHLFVIPRGYEEKRVVLFPGQLPYIYNGQPYDVGTHIFQLKTVHHNCDSIFKLEIVESEHYSDWDYVPLCKGGSIQIDTVTITKAGSYTFLYRSKVTGELDSLYRMEVYNAPAYDLPAENRVICQGDTVEWNGKKYWRTGDYELRGKTHEGCDSIAHLHLVVNPTYHLYEDATITDYESYQWRGSEYKIPGEYECQYKTQEGCDSIYTLTLRVMSTVRQHKEDTICKGETYTWRGKQYTQSGDYIDTLKLPGSLTSSIYTLSLHVVAPTVIRQARVDEICADQSEFTVDFSYSGEAPSHYSVFFDKQAKRQGFADMYDVPYHGDITIPMPTSGNKLYQDHLGYMRPDNYVMYIEIDNGVCGLTKSEDITLQVRYPSWIIEQFWGDVVAPLKPELNGGYDFSQYEWYLNGIKQNTDGRGYIYTDQLMAGDEVVLYATRKGENYAIPTCPLTIVPEETPTNDHPILVYPRMAPRQTPQVTVETTQDGTYRIYSETGQLLTMGTLTIGSQTLTLPAVSGYYLIQTMTHEGSMETHKIIIY